MRTACAENFGTVTIKNTFAPAAFSVWQPEQPAEANTTLPATGSPVLETAITWNEPGAQPWSARAESARATNRWLVLVLVCVAQFMVVLDATIVNVALPHIQSALGFSEASLQWVINAYTLVFAGFLLLGGRAGDLLGRKRLFLIGLVIFTVAGH